jgi:DNA-binding MarR family transcriptional regulator
MALVEMRRTFAGHGRPRTSPWLREARRDFPASARPLLDLLGPLGPWPDFVDSLAPDIEEALEEVRATSPAHMRWDLSGVWRDRSGRPPTWVRNLADGDREAMDLVVRALRDLHAAIITPRWDDALVALHADVAKRMPLLAAGGPEALFSTLHPKLRWRDDGLDRSGINRVCDLRGAGMVMIPSAFWGGEPVLGCTSESRPGIMLYATAPQDGHAAARDDADPAADSLAALIGPTRAAVLRALREPRGTAELADTVCISPATASEHAKVLREAQLIETRREGRAVSHSLTPLGRTILGQLPDATAFRRQAG